MAGTGVNLISVGLSIPADGWTGTRDDVAVGAAVAAVIAAVTSVVVAGLSLLLGDRQRRRREEQARRQDLDARYLNPLRLHLVENYYGVIGTMRQPDTGGGRNEAVLAVADPAEISSKDCRLVHRHRLRAGIVGALDRLPVRPAEEGLR